MAYRVWSLGPSLVGMLAPSALVHMHLSNVLLACRDSKLRPLCGCKTLFSSTCLYMNSPFYLTGLLFTG